MTTTIRMLQWCALVVALAGLASWRLAGAGAGPQSPQTSAVRIIPAGRPAGGAPGQKGATYYALEGRTTRFTTHFTDGTKAVAERAIDGDLETRLEDAQGNEINRFKVERGDGINDVLRYRPYGGTPVLAQPDPAVRQTLDWSNQQSYRLYRDRVASGTRLQWKGGLMRGGNAVPGDNERDVREVETQWANGLVARTVHRTVPKDGVVLVTRLTRDDVEVGLSNYLVRDRIYIWNMPGVSQGTIAANHLKAQYGGWPFTPDMVWMNLQALGTYHWATLLKEKGTVARQPSPRNPILNFFAPTLAANSAGCDGLNWLDGTSFRPCCDVHDNCYEAQTPACTMRSWWSWGRWECDKCNQFVWVCFVLGVDSHIRHPFGG
jgi:hypothetical protein